MIQQSPYTSKGLWRDESATNFFTSTLAAILGSSHRTSLPKLKEKGNDARDLLCFPWAVVEVKPNKEETKEFCYCQAANASSFALQLYEDLVYEATGHRDDTIPIVIAFTTVGPEYRVWLTHSSTGKLGRNCHVRD